MRGLPSLAVGLWLCVAANHAALAQFPNLTDQQKQYAESMTVLLDRWNDGKLKFEKTVAMQDVFAKRFDEFVGRASSGGIESVIPADFIQANWKALPDTLEKEKPLSNGATYLLVGAIIDAAPRLAEVGVNPDPDSLLGALEFPLYITLAAAQKEATGNEVDSVAVRRGGLWFFSLGWPFCCAE
jgi:hypothetical protein